MTTINLGVNDVPYPSEDGETKTTGQVAGQLELDYGIVGAFIQKHEETIADAIAIGVEDSMDAIISGSSRNINLGAATSIISSAFKEFLSNSEIESMGVPGVPTRAALSGSNSRLKKGFGPRRPSFIDTGLYRSSFDAWVSEDGE